MPVLNDTPGYQLVAPDIKNIWKVVTETEAYTTKYNDYILADATDAAFTLTLPAISDGKKGGRVGVKKIDSTANVITIATTGTEHIDGLDTVTIPAQYGHFEFETSGSQWYITSGKIDNIWNTWNVTAQTSAYNASFKDFVLGDASGGAFIITLPAVATALSGARIEVKKTDPSANVVTVATADAATIDGTNTIILTTQNEGYTMVTDGTDWYIE
jgi:hypothetical protein